MKIKALVILLMIVLIFVTSCTGPRYISEYEIDEQHIIRIPTDEQERGEYCWNICSKYTHDHCYSYCIKGNITERVITSYKKANDLLTTEELIRFCISMYGGRERQLQIYTDVGGRCTICEGELECPVLENEYVMNIETDKFEKK